MLANNLALAASAYGLLTPFTWWACSSFLNVPLHVPFYTGLGLSLLSVFLSGGVLFFRQKNNTGRKMVSSTTLPPYFHDQ